MKKLICFMMVMLLTLTVPTMALAHEGFEYPEGTSEHDKAWYAAQHETYTSAQHLNPLQLQLSQDASGIWSVAATYHPGKLTEYLLNNQYENWDASVTFERIDINIRIDDSKWMTAYEDFYGPVSQMINPTHQSETMTTEPNTWTIFNCTTDFDELDGPMTEYLDMVDGKPTLDLTKHTLYVKYRIVYMVDYYPYYTDDSQVAKITALTEETLPTELPAPEVRNPVASIEQQRLHFQVEENDIINALVGLGHEVELQAQILVNGSPYSESKSFALHENIYPSIAFNNKDWGEDSLVELKIAYFCKTLQLSSPWTTISSTVQAGENTDIPTFSQPEDPIPNKPKCNLCSTCPIQPLGLCLWVIVLGSMFGVTTVIFGILCIIDIFKKKTNRKDKK